KPLATLSQSTPTHGDRFIPKPLPITCTMLSQYANCQRCTIACARVMGQRSTSLTGAQAHIMIRGDFLHNLVPQHHTDAGASHCLSVCHPATTHACDVTVHQGLLLPCPRHNRYDLYFDLVLAAS